MEVCLHVAVFAPSTNTNVSVVRVVDVHLSRATPWADIIGNLLHAVPLPEILKLALSYARDQGKNNLLSRPD